MHLYTGRLKLNQSRLLEVTNLRLFLYKSFVYKMLMEKLIVFIVQLYLTWDYCSKIKVL